MKNIDKIIERYFDGESSLEDEKILRSYFQGKRVEERHRIYMPMFNFFSEERKIISTKKSKKKIPLYTWVGIAASIVLLIGIRTFFYAPMENSKSMVYINGEKITDVNIINNEVLNSISNISEVNEDIINSQIDILDSFTE